MFEYGSTLGLEIAETIQSACDKRDLVDKDLFKMRKEIVSRELETMVPKIESIIKRNTLLDVNVRNVADIRNAFATFKFNKNGTGKLNKYIDDRLYQKDKMKPKMAADLIKLSATFDEDRIDMSIIDEDIARCFEFDIQCDFVSFLCAETEINHMIGDFSANELTAVILHELGHILNNIRRLGLNKYRLELKKRHYTYFSKNASVEEKKKLIDITLKTMKKQKENKEIQLVLESVNKEMMDVISDDPKYMHGNTTGTFTAAYLIFMFILFLSGMYIFFVGFFGFMIGYFNMSQLIRKKDDDYRSDKDDFIASQREYQMIERDADEFVSKHGFGQHLSSALLKVRRFPIGGDQTNNKSKFIYYTSTTITYFIESFFSTAFVDIYPSSAPIYKRIEDIKLQTIKYLKSNSTNKVTSLIYLDSLDSLERDVKDTSNSYYLYKISLKMYRFLKNIISIPNIYSQVIHGTLPRDMEDLYVELDRIQNNSLYVASARLQQTLLKD